MNQQNADQQKNRQQKIQSAIVLVIMLILVILTAVTKHIDPNPLNNTTSADSSVAESSIIIDSSAIANAENNNKKSGISEEESKKEKIIIEALNNFDLSKGFQCTATFSDGVCTIIFDPSSNLMRCVMQNLSKQVIKQYLFVGSISGNQSSDQTISTTSTTEDDTAGFYVLNKNNAWQKIDEDTLENAEMDTDNSSYEDLQNMAMFQSIITMVSDAIDFDDAKVEMSKDKATATALNDVAIDGVNYQDTAVANFVKDKNGKYKTTSLLIKLYCKATKTDYVKLEIKDIPQTFDLHDPNFTLTN